MGKLFTIGFGIAFFLAIIYLIFGIAGGIGVDILAGIIFLVIAIILYMLANKTKPNPAMDMLKERYAKGEITKEQFDEMKKRLDELKE